MELSLSLETRQKLPPPPPSLALSFPLVFSPASTVTFSKSTPAAPLPQMMSSSDTPASTRMFRFLMVRSTLEPTEKIQRTAGERPRASIVTVVELLPIIISREVLVRERDELRLISDQSSEPLPLLSKLN